MSKMNSEEWSMCSRCPHRFIGLANYEESPARTGLDLEKSGRQVEDIEEIEDCVPNLRDDDSATSSSPSPPTPTLLPILNGTNPNPTYSSLTNTPPTANVSPLTHPEQDPLSFTFTTPTPPPQENICRRIGCQSSHWSDDSSDEDAETEEERDSPTKMRRILQAVDVKKIRKRVVRAFSGTDKEASFGGMERILEVDSLNEGNGGGEDAGAVAASSEELDQLAEMKELEENVARMRLESEIMEVEVERTGSESEGARIEVIVLETTDCAGCKAGVCPGARRNTADEGAERTLTRLQKGSCEF